MSKFKLFLICITPFLFVSVVGAFLFFNSDYAKIREISKNLLIIDANSDHNQALDVVEYAQKLGIDIPKTIINFDTHSDLYVYKKINPKYGAHIYDWLNEYFAKNTDASEIYWVMPTEEALDSGMQDVFIEKDEAFSTPLQGNSQKNEKDVNPFVDKVPYFQYFVIDTKNSYMTEIVQKEDEFKLLNQNPQKPRYKKIKVITCTKNTLPDFKNKNVILSIDADYISNSGYDTTNGFNTNKNEKEIKLALSELVSTIHKKHIRPKIITLTLSPKYVPEEDQMHLYDFFQKFIKYSNEEDALQEYTRRADSPKRKENEPKYKSF